jgi:hypothetical protein
MPMCPFCGLYVYKGEGNMICICGEELPEDIHKYMRESIICGKPMEFMSESDDGDYLSKP